MKKYLIIGTVALVSGAWLSSKLYEGLFNWQNGPSLVQISEDLSDGRVDVTIEQVGDLTLVIDVKMAAAESAIDQLQLWPEASLAMAEMHMDGISPMFSSLGAGVWQGKAVLPMSGPWVVSIGFGEEFIEADVDVR